MKKLFALLAIVALLLPSCQKIEDRIDGLENRIDEIEGTQIASLQQQINAINTTLPGLKQMDAELKEYITNLQTTATALQEKIEEANDDLKKLEAALDKAIKDAEASDDALKDELVSQLNTAKADVLAQLQSTKTALEAELAQINATIATLQSKDAELEQKITTLEEYVNSELQNTEDWVSATFATLEQYNSISSEIATIKQNIESLNESIEALEERLMENISKEIASAIEPIKNELVSEIASEITTQYTTAISAAKSEITAAYTAAISTAITNLEASMMQWVNNKLAGYYTIAETEAKLALLQSVLESQLASQKVYLEGLINSLSTELNGKISANSILIEALRTDVSTLEQTAAAHANNIANNAAAIAKNTESIIANAAAISANATEIENIKNTITSYKAEMASKISEIESRLTNIDADIVAINNEIEAVRNDYSSKISALQSTVEQKITDNTSLIEANQAFISENAAAIADNKSAIAALKASTDAAIAKNAADIATNAENIANNAALIAQNAKAISNNADAIAQNAADIWQLQQDLITTKNEITEAYTAAIETAITTLDGVLRGKIATEVATINARIDDEVETINNAMAALDERVTALEKEVKTIKVAIYNIQTEIAEIQEQIAALIERIQSVSFVPDYADGKATMYYTNSSGMITAGSATLKYEIRPASAAEELVDVWEEALSVKAVYTQTRAAGDFVALTIESVSANNDILSVVVSGANLSDDYFRGELSANVRLEISNGYSCLTSDYVNMVPWTTDTVYIPDANFKAYLLGEFDANGDNEISLEEAETIREINISASLLQVKSMAGIEYFSNLETLDCSYNRVTSLDLANNTKLKEVNVSNNKLTSLVLPASVVNVDASANQLSTLDVSKAVGLKTLNVANNKLASLNVAQNKALTSLNVGDNDLVSLDVTKLLSLTELQCGGNDISLLNLTKNTALTALDCHGNNLTSLDLTKNAALTTLDCGENAIVNLYLGTEKLTSLDCANNALVSINVALQTKLTDLDCSHNELTQLDVTKCTKLATLDCSYNKFESLNVSNNSALKTLDCSNNASMVKLWVKDNAQQNAVTITKDDTTTIYYNNGGLYIPDSALKAYLVNNYDDDGDGEISIAESDNITMVNCSGKGVEDLTGLESCTNLVTLNCSNNNITKIELPNLKQLKTVTCNSCPIERLNFDNCPSLQYLNLQGVTTNALDGTAISINKYTQATTFNISTKGTSYTSFSFTNDTDLTDIEFYGEFTDVNLSGNSILEGIDVSTLLQLETLDVQKCKLQSLDVTKNLALTSLICNNNELITLDVSNNTSLVKFYCNNNKLPRINVTANTALKEFDIANNLLSALNIRNNTALTYLCVSNNAELSMVDVKANTALETLYAEGLAIGDINLSTNNALTDVRLYSNSTLKTIVIWEKCKSRNDYLHFDMGGVEVYDNAGNSYGYPFSVGQYIPWFNGGVVYEISNNGVNGKIVSVAETSTSWGLDGTTTGATNSDDGMKNVNTMKSKGYFNRSSAFTWCANYGTDWYLPALNELKAIYNNKSTINSTLSAGGYTTLGTDYYWSSTEYISTKAYELDFGNGSSLGGYKSLLDNVRAVLAF